MKASEDSPGQFSTAAQGTIQLIVARVVFMACGYVASVVLARELGPASFGTYGIVMSLLLWLEVLGGLGVPRAAGKLIAQAADPGSLIEATFSALLMVGCLLLAVCWLAAPFVATYFGIPDGALLLRLAVIDLPFNAVYIAYHAVMIGQQRFRAMSLAIVAYGVTKLAGTLLLFWIGFSVEAALIANVLATVGGVAYLMPRFGLRLSWPNRDALRPIIALSAPIAVLVVTMQLLLSAHLWILKRIGTGSADTLGHYIAALNVAQLPSIVPAALGVVVLSSVALALGRQDAALARRHAASACRFVLLTLTPVCVLGAQQATAIMQLLYSEAYRAGGLYLGILLGGYGLFALLDTMLHALIGADRHRLATGLLLVLVPAVFLTGAALVGTWGATGAAASFLATFVLGNALATIAVYRRFGILPFRAVTVLRVAVATAAAALAGHFLVAEGIAVLLELGFLSAIYFAVLLLLREVSLRDLTHLAVWRRQSRP